MAYKGKYERFKCIKIVRHKIAPLIRIINRKTVAKEEEYLTIFNKYTRRNKVVKSIQFELIPEGRTKETMEQLKFEEKDASFREIADNLVPYIDGVIRTIVNHALSNFTYDFTNLENKADLEKSLEKQKSRLVIYQKIREKQKSRIVGMTKTAQK